MLRGEFKAVGSISISSGLSMNCLQRDNSIQLRL